MSSNEIYWCLLLSYFLAAAPLSAIESQSAPRSQRWLYGDGSIEQLLAARDDLEPWPLVASSNSIRREHAGESGAFRAKAVQVVTSIKEIQKKLARSDSSTFEDAARQLLQLRTLIAHGGGYINLLLADVIDRVIWVELLKRIASDRAATESSMAIMRSVTTISMNINTVITMVEGETGKRSVARDIITRGIPSAEEPMRSRYLSDAQKRQAVFNEDVQLRQLAMTALMSEVSKGALLLGPGPDDKMDSVECIRGLCLGGTLWRIMETDEVFSCICGRLLLFVDKGGSISELMSDWKKMDELLSEEPAPMCVTKAITRWSRALGEPVRNILLDAGHDEFSRKLYFE